MLHFFSKPLRCLFLVTSFSALGLSAVSLTSVAWAEEIDSPASQIRSIETRYVKANGIDIAYKILGEDTDPTILLIMGLGGSHVLWGEELPNMLVAGGYQVVLFDNRDVGESQRLDELGEPVIWWEFIKLQLGFEVNAAYDLSDMAQDTLALLDALEIQQAHVVGASMGGMIAQVLTARHPERVASLTSIMSTPGFADHLPPPGEITGQMSDEDPNESDEDRKARFESYGLYLDSMPRQMMAIIKSGDRSDEVKTITSPTLVMHGKDDTLIPEAHGAYTAELIQGSTYRAFDGMGHNMPPAVLPDLVANMLSHMKANDLVVSKVLGNTLTN